MIKLSVIIVSYNVCLFLKQTLLSIESASKNLNIEIIVVDNNSNDQSCEMVKKDFPNANLIANKVNLGFSKANNIAANIAKGKYLLILNPDIVIAENTFTEIISFAEQKEKFGILGVRLIDGTGKFLPESKRNIPSVKVATQKVFGFDTNYYSNQIQQNETSEVEILPGAFMLMKRKVYLELGGFDEDYFMYGEDVDLSYTYLNAGYKNYYLGSCTAIHYKGESTIKNADYFKNFYGAMEIFYSKHFKVNPIVKWGLTLMKKGILIKPNKKIEKSEHLALLNLYYGKNPVNLGRINQSLDNNRKAVLYSGNEENHDFDEVIFDNNDFSFEEIISLFQDHKFDTIKKRIIPKGTRFYIGSDSSQSRGEEVAF